MSVDVEKIREVAQTIAEREQCLLYDLELTGAGNGRILRVFIDKKDGTGVSVNDCSNVSRALDLLLDVEGFMGDEAYNLEVSSPGLERNLRVPWHFEKATGRLVQLQLTAPLGEIDESAAESDKGRKKVSGLLQSFEDGQLCVVLAPDSGAAGKSSGKKTKTKAKEGALSMALNIPMEKVRKAKLVFDFDQGYQPKR